MIDLSAKSHTLVLQTAFQWLLDVHILVSKYVTSPMFETKATVTIPKHAIKQYLKLYLCNNLSNPRRNLLLW